MQSLRSFLSIRPFQVCLRRLQLRTPLTCVVILSFLVCKSSECSWPCDTSICEDMSGCEYGVVKDRCNCCDRCVSGPGQICGGSSTDYGPCAAGYECVPFPGYPHEEEEMLGTCTAVTTQPPTTPSAAATTQPPTTPSAASTTEASSESTTSSTRADSSTDSVSLTTTQEVVPLKCKKKCSPDFCTGNQVCSARGLEDIPNLSRNACQHTSCHACFLLIRPQCDFQCGEPPTKRCLGKFFRCVQDHYLQPSLANLILKLDDPRARDMASRGRVICSVPSLLS